MALCVYNDDAVNMGYLSTAPGVGVPTNRLWAITSDSNGYLFQYIANGSVEMRPLNGTTYAGTNVVVASDPGSPYNWTMSRNTTVANQVLLINTSNGLPANNAVRNVTGGETKTLESLNLMASLVSPYTNYQNIRWYSSDSSIAVADVLTGSITGRFEGETTIYARETYNGSPYEVSYSVQVPEQRKAIIIVPGITCSSLQNANGEKEWLYLGRESQIACNENGLSINAIYPYNPDNYGVLDIYERIYNRLVSEYSDDYDINFFAYDWRMSCADAAEELEELTDGDL